MFLSGQEQANFQILYNFYRNGCLTGIGQKTVKNLWKIRVRESTTKSLPHRHSPANQHMLEMKPFPSLNLTSSGGVRVQQKTPLLNLLTANFFDFHPTFLKFYDFSQNQFGNILVRNFFWQTTLIFDDVIIFEYRLSQI